MWVIEVDLALTRPPRVHRTSRVILGLDLTETDATLMAVSMATQVHKAEMPVGHRIIQRPEAQCLS